MGDLSRAAVLVLAVLSPAVAAAQSAGDEPGGGAGDEPGGTAGDEPGGGAGDEPESGAPAATPLSGAEPAPDEPLAPVAGGPVKAGTKLAGIGFRTRYVALPRVVLDAVSDYSQPISSVAFAGEFTWQKVGGWELLGSLELGLYAPEDGNFLGNGEDPATDTDYVQFKDVRLISADVTLLGESPMSKWLSFVYGGGLGLGLVTGEIWRASSGGGQGNRRCTRDNLDDCRPVTCTYGEACTRAQLNLLRDERDPHAAAGSDRKAYYQEDDVPPVIPIVNLVAGLRIRPHRHFQVRLDAGFRVPAFFAGGALVYLF